ncbi:hypothetical protein HPCPY6271_0027 [Helicobacter pylori CPY6271]|nr:hypothetical protein HPCPY6271_0027 [Helicobacter pylori CPY6271]
MGTQKLKNKIVQENPTNPFLMRLPFFKLIVVATMPPFSIYYIIRYEREKSRGLIKKGFILIE